MEWRTFLRAHRIEYVTTGPNASRGHVNIKCPFCGDDPSEHLGISLRGRGWSCWRNREHRGRSPVRLIQALLHCSAEEASRVAYGERELPPDGDLASEVSSRLGVVSSIKATKTLHMPEGFKSLNNGSVFAKPFLGYLRERGYHGANLEWLIKAYDLHYSRKGAFGGRIIIPYYDRYRKLLTWTARAISPDVDVRYKSLKGEEQVCSPKSTLLGLPLLWQAENTRVLCVCEGPFDAMWISAWGSSWGVYGTCLSGLSMSADQVLLLAELRSRFDRVALLLDHEATMQSFRLAHSGLDSLLIQRLPKGVKDPAELPPKKAIELCVAMVS